jgi:hypothetical protein
MQTKPGILFPKATLYHSNLADYCEDPTTPPLVVEIVGVGQRGNDLHVKIRPPGDKAYTLKPSAGDGPGYVEAWTTAPRNVPLEVRATGMALDGQASVTLTPVDPATVNGAGAPQTAPPVQQGPPAPPPAQVPQTPPQAAQGAPQTYGDLVRRAYPWGSVAEREAEAIEAAAGVLMASTTEGERADMTPYEKLDLAKRVATSLVMEQWRAFESFGVWVPLDEEETAATEEPPEPEGPVDKKMTPAGADLMGQFEALTHVATLTDEEREISAGLLRSGMTTDACERMIAKLTKRVTEEESAS